MSEGFRNLEHRVQKLEKMAWVLSGIALTLGLSAAGVFYKLNTVNSETTKLMEEGSNIIDSLVDIGKMN